MRFSRSDIANLGYFLAIERHRNFRVAGEELLANIAEPFARIDYAVDGLNRFRASPTGRIRLNVLDQAATHLLAPVIPVFLDRYPDAEIDLAVTNSLVDVVDGGFDAASATAPR